MSLPQRDERPPEIIAGQKLGEQFMTKIARDGYGVFDSCFAAQVILTHCKARMGPEQAAAWNAFLQDLLKELYYQ